MGTRLAPITNSVSKQLLPVFDKPMIYYALTTLMEADIREILIITKECDLPLFKNLFSDFTSWGVHISFAIQKQPDGIASALIIAEDFLQGLPSALILGDNIFYAANLNDLILNAGNQSVGATIFTKEIKQAEHYGVVEVDANGKAISIEEKPEYPKSNLAVTGLYFFDETAPERAKRLKPSKRGELEITHLIATYLSDDELHVSALEQSTLWFDAGNALNLLKISNLVASIQDHDSILIGSPEETALKKGWVSLETFTELTAKMKDSSYQRILKNIILHGHLHEG
jgi:glucose-1-phosphate thymidylyltransferase